MPAHVLILMSVYNGAAYLAKQLDSLFAQTDVTVDLLVRDDGSSDPSVDILRAYRKMHPNIRILRGTNIGFAQSFWHLIITAPDSYDYYALCDQDDLWYPEKLSIAVNMIREQNADKLPILYTANIIPIDAEDHPLFIHPFNGRELNIYESFQHSILPGCTFVFNNPAKKLLSRFHGRMYAHDWAAYCIIRTFGIVIYDSSNALTGYRFHSGNAIGAKKGLSYLKMKLRNFLSKSTHVRSHFAQDFYRVFRHDLTDETVKRQIFLLAFYRKRLSYRIMLALSPHFKGGIFRSYVLMGKI